MSGLLLRGSMKILGMPDAWDEMLKRRGELQDNLLILSLLRRKEIVWWIWWMRHAVFTIISLSKITAQTRGGFSRQVRVYWIWRKIDVFHTFCFTSCKQYGSVFLLPRKPISGQRWTAFLLSTSEPNLESESGDIVFSHFQCQAWLRQFVIWLHLERTNLASSRLDSLLPAITNMVSLSLQTGYFAETWNPSLKKPGLDLLLKHFRLISSLQFVTCYKQSLPSIAICLSNYY